MAEVNVELGYSSTAQISLNDAAVRNLAGIPSGTISLDNLHGKSNSFSFTISSNQTNADLRTLAINAGWNQSSALVATISSGVYISSNNTGTPALTVSGSFPGGVSLTNNGYIIGMGGAGGAGGSSYDNNPGGVSTVTANNGSVGSSGGLALSVSSAVTITNNNTIGGGGGGGGGGGSALLKVRSGSNYWGSNIGGSGGGGGRSSAAANSSGGAAGSGWMGGSIQQYRYGNTGNAGTSSSGGATAAAVQGLIVGPCNSYPTCGSGGAGGSWGAAGATGGTGSNVFNNCQASLNYQRAGGSGGSAGGAVSGNANITWVATGTRLGSIS